MKEEGSCSEIKPICDSAFLRIEEKLNLILDTNKKLNEAIYGNGKAGLNQRMHDAELFLSTAKWVVVLGAALFCTQFFELLLSLFRDHQ